MAEFIGGVLGVLLVLYTIYLGIKFIGKIFFG